MTASEDRHPTVLISYSHDTPEHEARVLDLCNRLRARGVDTFKAWRSAALSKRFGSANFRPETAVRQIDTDGERERHVEK